LNIPPGANVQTLRANLSAISARESRGVKNTRINLSIQPMNEIALGEELNNSIGPVMGSSNVWMIGVLSFIVILSACFNYTNLSIARSMRRSREVGIRKVVGALRSHVVAQFVIEAVMIALLSLAFSFLLFGLLKPFFLSLSNQYQDMLVLDVSPEVILYFVGLAIAVGVIAGVSPAVFFARVNAIHVLKNVAIVRGFRNVTMRKGLIIAQFTISLMFIAATIIGYKHYTRLLAFDLGFKTENILNIKLHGHPAALLKKELEQIPEINDMSSSSIVTSVGNYFATQMKYNEPHDSASVYFNAVDENYLPLHGHKLLAGRNFSANTENSQESEVIVNEQVLRRFKIAKEEPQKAVGEIVTVDRKKMQIVGVVKDFYYGKSTDKEIREVIFRYSPEKVQYVNATVVSTDWPATLNKIGRAWKKIDDVHPLEATFYNDEIERSYSDFSAKIKVIGSLAFLAICIASIGLLGMVVFTTETRIKEISIRKIMGATDMNLVFLLSKGFLLLMLISAIVALPSTHLFFTKFVFDEYADGAPIAWNELTIGVLSVLAIAFLMIGSHTLSVARSNPAEVLKNE
jgi:ABC-type antimicrobial peptide transport system permease subunit